MENVPPRKNSRGLKAVLAVSLALNLCVIGIVAGSIIRHDGWSDRGMRPPALNAFGAPYMLALPRDERRKVLGALRAKRAEVIPSRQSRRAMYADVMNALRTTPFDRSALEAAARIQAKTSVSVQNTVQAAWLDVVTEMTDQERRDYADGVEEILRRGQARSK